MQHLWNNELYFWIEVSMRVMCLVLDYRYLWYVLISVPHDIVDNQCAILAVNFIMYIKICLLLVFWCLQSRMFDVWVIWS